MNPTNCNPPVNSSRTATSKPGINSSQRRFYKKQRASGKCVQCSESAVPGRAFCEQHKNAKRRYYHGNGRKRRLERNAAGLCEICDTRLGERSKRLCDHHLDIVMSRNKKCQDKRRGSGLCVHCGLNPPSDGKMNAWCESCRKSAKEYSRVKRAGYIAKGLCGHCGQRPFVNKDRSLCGQCFIAAKASKLFGKKKVKLLWDKFDATNETCPYTGRKLILGFNTELDHITPKTRGGSHELENLQWVSFEANQMKFNFTEPEFLELVRDIAIHRLGMIDGLLTMAEIGESQKRDVLRRRHNGRDLPTRVEINDQNESG